MNKLPKIDLRLYMSDASLVFSEELLYPDSMKQYFLDQQDKNKQIEILEKYSEFEKSLQKND